MSKLLILLTPVFLAVFLISVLFFSAKNDSFVIDKYIDTSIEIDSLNAVSRHEAEIFISHSLTK